MAKPGADRQFLIRCALAGAYLALAIWKLHTPAVGFEQILPVSAVLANLTGDPGVQTYYKWFDLGGWVVPVFRGHYIGAVVEYLMFPLMAVLGPNAAALRLGEILIALASALILSAAVGRLAGRRAGTLALFLTLFHSTYFCFSKTGFFSELAPQTLFAALSAYCFVRWSLDRRPGWAFLWALMLGLGVYAKLLMLWHALGYVMVYLVHWLLWDKPFRWKEALAFAAGLALSPYALLNLSGGGHAARVMISRLQTRHELYDALSGVLGKPDFGFWDFCLLRLEAAVYSLTHLTPQIPIVKPSVPLMLLLGAAYVPLAVYLWRGADKTAVRRTTASWVLVCLVFYAGLCTPVESFGEGYDHATPVLVLALAALAVALDRLIRRGPRLCLAALLLYAGHLAVIAKFLQRGLDDLRANNSAERVLDYMLSRGIHRPVCVSGNQDFALTVTLLSEGRVRPRPSYREELLAPGPDWYVAAVTSRPEDDVRYKIVHAKAAAEFEDLLRRKGLRETDRRFFFDGSGPQGYKFFRLAPARGSA
jgi:hypothetical protein